MATSEQARARGGKYVDAGGVRTYYEVAGAGEPLVLLHGGFCTVETFGAQTPALAEQYQVYVPERRGHGRTPDVEGPITYENMAQDTIAFMEALGTSSAHLVGWSDGAIVGLLVALRRPDLVRKLVLIGQAINHAGYTPEGERQLENLTRQDIPPMLGELYASVSPDGPDHFGVVFDKLHQLWMNEPMIELGQLDRVAAPTLVLVADDDIGSTVEYAAAMRDALPDSQLAVVPGTSHAALMEKPEIVNRLILDFLAPEQVTKMFG
jgi:pimeloyl-ACP methyl ester carboxylesterase